VAMVWPIFTAALTASISANPANRTGISDQFTDGAQIAARRFTAHAGRRFDPAQRPPEASECQDLLLGLFVQDVAHSGQGP
jgi:hypothetical protein